MCGIVAVASRRSDRQPPELNGVVAAVRDALALVRGLDLSGQIAGPLATIAESLLAVDRQLIGVPGLQALLTHPEPRNQLAALCEEVAQELARCEVGIEAGLERGAITDHVEVVNAALIDIKDALWAISHDRLRNALAIDAMRGDATSIAATDAFHAIQLTLSAIDRLEVRGRDSAGLHVLIRDHHLDAETASLQAAFASRAADPLFCAGSVRAVDGCLSFVYKTAAEIGELGDNTAALRHQISNDPLLRAALAHTDANALIVAHTRWASIGIISEPNTHPLNSEAAAQEDVVATPGPYVVGVLNGDVDNYADLAVDDQLHIAAEITTDAKVIPMLVSNAAANGVELSEAFRSVVSRFEGSVAIAASCAGDPNKILLAQRGSGQALYVGLGEDVFIVASEPYGLVEIAPKYFRLDGETMRTADDPGTQGQVVVLDAALAGDISGVLRFGYEGTPLPLSEDQLQTPQMTTRDVDRGTAPHYFWKEITESPNSFRKTLRGKIVADANDRLSVALDATMVPLSIRARLRAGSLNRAVVIGQGTAAVAGQSLAYALQRACGARLGVEAMAATELSGFGLRDDMSDTLVIAISQSGTTTDTNRTVDLARLRGAAVLAIVNRRQSDLVDKSDGVVYTSDGRDVEMAVASTKAFYAQIAAGLLLAYAIGDELGTVDAAECHTMLTALRALPAAMHSVVQQREAIGAIALRHAPYRRSWTVVGNGVNRVAAQEARIKLSELCYKSIGCDSTEDKKHIDLSAEPMILVCAAGLTGSNADDVAKEVAIFRAHKAAPIVIATEGETRFGAALDTVFVPAVHPGLDFVLSAMVGHVFGYEAALAIDASALPMREMRAGLEHIVSSAPDDDAMLAEIADHVAPIATRCFEVMRSGSYNGALEASTAVRLVSVLRYAMGIAPLDAYQIEFGTIATPSTLVEDMTVALTAAIDELTRPVDAIKHQAKTVTVGISRSDETLLRVRLVQEVLAAGAPRDALSYRSLRTLVELDAAVADVIGFTRYRIEGDIDDDATIHVVDRGGVAAGIVSRTDADPRLRGSKHRAAFEREVTVVRGRADGRTMIFVPEIKGAQTVGLTLLHADFHQRVSASDARRVLSGYRGRYAAIQDQVTETEPVFRDAVLADIDLVDLLTQPVVQLAEHWRSE